MTAPLEERALTQVVDFYMQADAEWLVRRSPTSVSYWFSGLKTRIRSHRNEDGSVKLRSETVVVTDVADSPSAEHVCAELNSLSPSWAFVFDQDERVISAVSSVVIYLHEVDSPPTFVGWEPAPFQDAWMILFAMSIWGHARLSADVAEIASQLCGGTAAWSKPDHQPDLRRLPDVFALLPDVLHQRPEWLRDYGPFTRWPESEEVANQVASLLREEVDSGFQTQIELAGDSVRVSVAIETNLISQWLLGLGMDTRYGMCAVTTAHFGRPRTASNASVANQSNLVMSKMSNTSQLGNWTCDDSTLTYTQAIPAAHLRTLEDSAATYALNNYNPVFFARLAARAGGAFDCVQEVYSQTAANAPDAESSELAVEPRETIFNALSARAEIALSEMQVDDEYASSDPAALSLPSADQYFVIGMFNPYGPTLLSLESLMKSDGESVLVEVQRHPFYPSVRKVEAGLPPTAGFGQQIESVLERSVKDLPSYIDISGCPAEFALTVSEVIKRVLLQIAVSQNLNMAALIQRIRETVSDPWSRIAHDLPELPDTDSAPTSEQIDEYFALITSQENLVPFWMEIPNAWDGAINANLDTGLLETSDIGPLVWRYNHKIGLIK